MLNSKLNKKIDALTDKVNKLIDSTESKQTNHESNLYKEAAYLFAEKEAFAKLPSPVGSRDKDYVVIDVRPEQMVSLDAAPIMSKSIGYRFTFEKVKYSATINSRFEYLYKYKLTQS